MNPLAPSPAFRLTRLVVLGLGAALVLFPYLWMVSASLKAQTEIFADSLRLWPTQLFAAENYAKALTRIPMARILANGALVCGLILVFQVLFALPCAYALAKLDFRGRQTLFALVLLGLLVPIHAISIPLYAAARDLSLLNTYTVLVAPFLLSTFAIFLFRQFIRALPDDLIAAARMDGLSEGAIVWRIVLPNAWPAATAFAVFSVVAHWNDLYWPLITVSQTSLATPPLGLLFFRAAEAGDDYGALMAATVVVTTPLVVLFLLAQRRFIDGMTMTGVKG
jgi:multiple sugar transport system permease protein